MHAHIKESVVTSSENITLEISRLCLRGEGDAIRNLESITKWTFSQRQYPLDRFHYRITNIATDFRDGVRLTKLVELLSENDSFTPLLQWPVKNSAQRIYNLNIALKAAHSEGIQFATVDNAFVQARDIEMGNREKTLAVLWNLIQHWCLPRYLSRIQLPEEVVALRNLFQAKKGKAPELIVRVPERLA